MSPVINLRRPPPENHRCKPGIQWRYNGELYAICSPCPWMRGPGTGNWPAGAPWPCNAKKLPD